ncbi:four helix bundle protein [Elizabethkingia anophelis]|uniref:Four helix bundle protein n=1 Tax=Elizabethkingia anophelis TaxID=1117645 RepID=A0A1T3D3Z3_9FLAO|nr:four helix bundle protein [Elizabethkingia anophelis]AQW99411.1 four helix bundle protein [Elizabethkingia anophelis]AQX51737.1 four helix bundle protein [Elizabethkingia anophelis]AQX89959.1 four helix bundle protein [Elizabethkingia anophelis]ASV79277.1 four helix bundle protein [Elizabethkingia anophelis]EHM7980334.1 four helix bundle protein [Elizabethkingia anophelis]
MHNFRELEVWKKAMELTTIYYQFSQSYPKEEIFGLISQSRRSLVSIASNIAEGAGRNTSKQFVQFLNIALGSSFEFETQLLISFNLKYISDENYEFVYKNLKHIQNMLVRLIDNYK